MAAGERTGEDWNEQEIDLIVADYFEMLKKELRGEAYVKSKHNAELQRRTGRSRGSIEFKHQNISAVLDALCMPWIPGYKPMANFQHALFGSVEKFIDERAELIMALPAKEMALAEQGALFIGEAPVKIERPEDSNPALARLVRKFDPATRDERNRALGKLGEERVWKSEQARLRAEGRDDLASKVKWVARDEGDGAGFDILSFTAKGAERFLEVKTTQGGEQTPFFISRNEKAFAEERPDGFRIFRLYDFAKDAKAFKIAPPLESRLILEAANYRASFR
jgi:hypothetical protein